MDLPLDWKNVFNIDERMTGVHVETISDALVLSLTSLHLFKIKCVYFRGLDALILSHLLIYYIHRQ